MEPADVLTRARRWLADDPDPVTRAELAALVDRASRHDGPDSDRGVAAAELADRFRSNLQFGTAGLRGALGAGPNRMNRVVVIQAAYGLAHHLRATRPPLNGRRHHVVIGYDARHGSAQFARDTAAVVVGAGLDASVLPRALPTPVLAFALRHLDADAGVMVTASHNPPQDNGYKVYLGGPDGGAQIVAPTDVEIAARIAACPPVRVVPRPDVGWNVLGEEVVDAYVDRAAGVAAPGGPRDLRIVLTSLHGVGAVTAVRTLAAAGFTDVHQVPEQATPDPDFPTVAFPNPEEPGALDLATALARRVDADVVIAHDPDADRCAVAVPSGWDDWRVLHGDELGALLGDHLARRGVRGTLASSIVSSRWLSAIAAGHGLPHVTTLTGFKWIARVPNLAFGYEEALGYCVDPDAVRDKDGIAAAVLVAELAAGLRAEGRTVQDRLDELAARHGVHLTDQISRRLPDPGAIGRTMSHLRAQVHDHPPATLTGAPVTEAADLSRPDGGLPPTDGVRYATADGSRVVIRPSGTEPKLKCYLEVVVDVEDDTRESVAAARLEAAERMAVLRDDVVALLSPTGDASSR